MKGLRTMKEKTEDRRTEKTRRTNVRRTVVLAILTLFLATALVPALAGDTPAVAASIAVTTVQKVVLVMNHDVQTEPDNVKIDIQGVIAPALARIYALSDEMKARGYAGLDPWVLIHADNTAQLKQALSYVSGDASFARLPVNRVWGGQLGGIGWRYVDGSETKFFNVNGATMWGEEAYKSAKMEISVGHNKSSFADWVEYLVPGQHLSYPFCIINLQGCNTTGIGANGDPTTPSQAVKNVTTTTMPEGIYNHFMMTGYGDTSIVGNPNFFFVADVSNDTGPFTNEYQVFEENQSMFDYSRPFNDMGPCSFDPAFTYTMAPYETMWSNFRTTAQLVPTNTYYWKRLVFCKYANGSMTGRQFWELEAQGNDPIIPPPDPTDPKYLQPGANLGNFQEWILLSNPNSKAANVMLSVFNQYGKVGDIPRTVPAGGRETVCVNSYMNNQPLYDAGARSVSVRVSSDVPIVAERAQYFGNALGGSLDGGTCASGQKEGQRFFFADGCGAYGWSTFYCVYNSGSAGDAVVDFTFAGGDGNTWRESYLVKKGTRFTLAGRGGMNYAVKIESSAPVVVERAMYHPNGGGAEGGTTATSTKWRFAEGYAPQDSSWRTFVLVQNTSNSVSSLAIETLPTAGGTPVKHSINLPPRARYTYEVPSGTGDFGVQVSGSQPLIAEMTLMTSSGISQIAGVPSEAGFPRKVLFAEGSNYGWPNGFGTYVLLTNFSKETAGRVQVRYLMQGEAPITQEWTVGKGARLTIGTGNYPELQGKSFGVEVSVLSGDILATRSMTFTYAGWIRGISGNNGIPEEGAGIELFFAEGYTGN